MANNEALKVSEITTVTFEDMIELVVSQKKESERATEQLNQTREILAAIWPSDAPRTVKVMGDAEVSLRSNPARTTAVKGDAVSRAAVIAILQAAGVPDAVMTAITMAPEPMKTTVAGVGYNVSIKL